MSFLTFFAVLDFRSAVSEFQHDLCLITGQNIPQMPGVPQLNKLFADSRQELRTIEVFVTRFNVRYKRSDICTRNYITGLPRKALMSEIDYF